MILLAVCVALLAGCAFGYQAEGRLAGLAGPLHGKGYPGVGGSGGEFELLDSSSGLRCHGEATPAVAVSADSCLGDRGTGVVRCSDGRVIPVTWEAVSCRAFAGEGWDERGNRLVFRVDRRRD